MCAQKTLQDLGLGQTSHLINDLFLDSRLVAPKGLFFAYPGLQADGRKFIDQAVARGATAVVYESVDGFVPERSRHPNVLFFPLPNLAKQLGQIAARFYDEPSRALNVIGVTGTNGKTSITQFIAQALQHHGHKIAVLGTIGNGVWPMLTKSEHTTEDAITLQKTFLQYKAQGVTDVAMEVSSHALAQGRMVGTQVNTAVFTQLSRDHLDYHGSMEAYAAAKGLLFTHPGVQHAVINAEDPYGRAYIKQIADHVPVVTYSTSGQSQKGLDFVFAKDVITTPEGYLVKVISSFGEGEFLCGLLGAFNVANVLATLAVLLVQNIPFDQAIQDCAQLTPVLGRMQKMGGQHQPQIIVDYAHTPDALEKALAALRAHCQGKLWCVFGCGGDRDRGKRPLMASVAERLADHVIITNDNPRTENPLDIVKDMLAGVTDKTDIQVVLDRREAIQTAVQSAMRHDMVLVAGKGHETTQTIGQHILPFDDALEVQLALNKVS